MFINFSELFNISRFMYFISLLKFKKNFEFRNIVKLFLTNNCFKNEFKFRL